MDENRPSPVVLTLHEVLDIHQDQFERYGGESGTPNRGHLDAALAQPQATYGGRSLYDDLFEMAAAYLYHLVQNHAFVDGNKRVGTVAAIVFLSLNGFDLDADPGELENSSILSREVRLVATTSRTSFERSAFDREGGFVGWALAHRGVPSAVHRHAKGLVG